MQPIKLMKSTFFHETAVKESLCDFIMRADRLSMGETCHKFEVGFAKFQGSNFATLYNSGSSANLALIQALINLGRLKKGDKVGISAVTWATNPMPLMQLGLEVVPVDVEIDTLNVSSRLLESTLNNVPTLKCLFITNLLGLCDDIGRIKTLCDDRNIILIEDNCESLGTVYQGKKLGNFGLASTFSMFVGHHLSSIEGGIICSGDKEVDDMCKMVRAHGWSRSLDESARVALRNQHQITEFYDQYTFYEMGYNLRPTELTGFLGLTQIQYAQQIVDRRENNFDHFLKASLRNNSIHHLKTSHIQKVSNFAFPVVCKDKGKFNEMLLRFRDNQVEIRPLVAGNIARQPFFLKAGGKSGMLPSADKVHDFGFYFPNNPELNEEEIERLCKCLNPD